MAATGGGKIRSRRSHIASKPYAKNKQQTGLISRVTDTVKSIVPTWLQRYFNNEGGSPGASEQGTEQNCQPSLPPNGSEEGPPPLDGRDSPEPSTSNAEPSTSRASLNFQEYVLSRPPLSRSHLHFPPLDTSSPAPGTSTGLFSQPSTSSAPGPFTTGFSLVKEIKDNLSQHEDDNISTTSGFSSRASDKDVPNSKTASLPQLWSPEMERTHSGHHSSQASMKKPSFNLSVFGNSSNSTLNSTILNSSQLGDSPFYPGKTTYGGAAAVRSSRTRPGTPYQAPVRRQIKAKPAGAQPCGVTSATARRILQSLERMSSPLADARRIPSMAASSLSPSLEDPNIEVSPFQAKKKRMESLPPVQKLTVPSVAPVSTNRSVAFRPTLTPGVMSRALDRTPRNTPTRQSPQLPEMTPSTSTFGSGAHSYPLSSTPAASAASSGGGKMKREKSTARPSSKRQDDDEIAEAPDLPAISLPISSSALPTFTFSSPLATTTSSPAPTTLTVTPIKEPSKVINMEHSVASSPPSLPFTFSSPIVKATAASPPSFSSTGGYTFSAPVAKLGPSVSNGNSSSPPFASGKTVTTKSTEEFEGPFKPAKTLKQGSVLDLLKDPGFSASGTRECDAVVTSTPSSSSTTTISPSGLTDIFKPQPGWSCDVCLVRNKPTDTKCVCCSTSQPSDSKPAAPLSTTTSTSSPVGFGNIFAKPIGTWDCDTCLVHNKPEAVKCVACETAKPGTGLKSSLTLPSAFSAVKSPSPNPLSTGSIGFGDKFKPPEGSWKCGICMVQNKGEDSKCVACTTPKPGASGTSTTEPAVAASSAAPSLPTSTPVFGFGDKFKKPEGAWSCDVCLLSNKADEVKCIACQTLKPGANVESKAFGSSTETSTSTFGSSASSDIKFGTTDGSYIEVGGFKFGGSFPDTSSTSAEKETPAPTFTFGKPEEKEEASPAPSGFMFSAANKDPAPAPASTGGFSFGKASAPAVKPTFAFGKPADKPESSTSEPPKPVFSFGQNAAESTAAPKPAFSFMASNPTTSSTSTPTPTLFGNSSTTSAPAAAPSPVPSTFVFGQPASSNTDPPQTKAFVFGQSADGQPAAPSTPAQPFIFGASANAAPAAPSFNFGGGAPPAAASTAPPAAPSPFVFNPASSGSFPASQTPSFGSSFAAPFPAQSSQPPAFGANTNAAPVFGQTNSAPVFGAAASSTPAGGGFQFGGAGAFGPSNSGSGVFTFGAGSASAAPAAPIAPQPAAAPGGFNFSPTPAFNIGSNKSFSSPGGQAIAGRRIKTAVRRRK
uniref:Nuclear pore complex protein Nup153 n=1 Tax=Knipowitschia caucasica TaxID=637954 RepID=A0AAV2K9W0_KNICA